MNDEANVAVEMVEEAKDVLKGMLMDEIHEHALTYDALRANTVAMNRLQEKHNELILNVISKHPNESRHETALRYIRAGGGL